MDIEHHPASGDLRMMEMTHAIDPIIRVGLREPGIDAPPDRGAVMLRRGGRLHAQEGPNG